MTRDRHREITIALNRVGGERRLGWMLNQALAAVEKAATNGDSTGVTRYYLARASNRSFSRARTAVAGESDAIRGGWLSARTYDLVLHLGEKAGMAAHRRALLTHATGTVLEIGAGTGLNLLHYPDRLERLVLSEPERHMAKRLERRIAQLGRHAEIVRATAEMLPFDDASFDTVVSTFVLCTVADPEAVLDEIRRVLRPGGSLLLLEHVRSDEPRLGRWQDLLQRPWQAIADGCNCNRRTLERTRNRGFDLAEIENARWRRMPPLVRPLIAGRATSAAQH